MIEAVGQTWQVGLAGVGSMHSQPWLEIDAVTGRVHRVG